ncbi:Uncharacterized protein Rs2_20199 [Raphanus sativus]|nr:Uncharacterized protein Rs2_20199 [Raphanus sativus]
MKNPKKDDSQPKKRKHIINENNASTYSAKKNKSKESVVLQDVTNVPNKNDNETREQVNPTMKTRPESKAVLELPIRPMGLRSLKNTIRQVNREMNSTSSIALSDTQFRLSSQNNTGTFRSIVTDNLEASQC